MSFRRLPLALLTLVALAACSDEAANSEPAATPNAAATPAPATPAAADVTDAPSGYPDRFLGKPDAPVTVVEYASLTCIHCAHFHSQVLPTLRATYIDTGKVRWIFRDFPLDRLSLSAAQLSRCLPKEVYFKFVGLLFENRDYWLKADGNLAPLKQLGMLAGLSGEQADACLTETRLRDAIVAERLRAATAFKVQATPTLFIAGQPLPGELTATAVGAALDKAVAAAE
jgi:protein-disulfide isomerase